MGTTKGFGPRFASLKLESNTSILRFGPSSAAYRNGCPSWLAMARPVYMAPADDLSAARVALVPPTPGFHPLIVPSWVEKMKREFAETCFPVVGSTTETTKAVTPLGVSGATIPVGVPCPPVTGGTVTTRLTMLAETPFVLLMA